MGRLSVGGVVLVGALVVGGAAAAASPAPAPGKAAPAADGDWKKLFSLAVDLGPGGVFTDYSSNPSPNSLLFVTGLRASLDFAQNWSGGLVLRQWWLPNDDHAFMMGPTARFEPVELWSGRVFAEGSLGLVSTRNNWTVGFDVAGGLEWDIPDAAGVSIGPYLRIGYVPNPNEQSSNDGSAWSVGAAITYHFGRAVDAAPGVGAKKRGPFKVTITDTDRDGIGDDRDECPNDPVGKHPDQFKVGCPESDSDDDGIPDSEDPCPALAPGDTPDPNRKGCPMRDGDNDGVPDSEDACPAKAGAKSSDPVNNGCPVKKQRGPKEEPEESAKPDESMPAPLPSKKRKMK